MKRYDYTNIVKDSETGVRRYQSTYYVKLKPSLKDEYIITVQGDRLDLLAHKYYNDVTKWIIIAVANDIGKGSLSIEPGIQLRIPMDIDLFEDKLKIQK